MAKLTEEYGIRVDSRYTTCVREALLSLALFLAAAVATLVSIRLLTTGRAPAQYGSVLGMPSYLFVGIIVVHAAFLIGAILAIGLLFREVPLEPRDPEDDGT